MCVYIVFVCVYGRGDVVGSGRGVGSSNMCVCVCVVLLLLIGCCIFVCLPLLFISLCKHQQQQIDPLLSPFFFFHMLHTFLSRSSVVTTINGVFHCCLERIVCVQVPSTCITCEHCLCTEAYAYTCTYFGSTDMQSSVYIHWFTIFRWLVINDFFFFFFFFFFCGSPLLGEIFAYVTVF